MPFLDRDGVVFAVKLSTPPLWEQRATAINHACDLLHAACGPREPHRRGDFDSCSFGFSYGGGQSVSLL